jgi:DNA-binding IclR family transcriptional regulator
VLAALDGQAESLRRELAAVREAGVVVTHGELDPGVSGVAAPVLAPGGRPVAAVTLAGPTDRVGPQADRLSQAVREAARAIERALPGG